MDEDSLHKRGHALESAFFSKIDQQLLEEMRKDLQQEDAAKRLQASTGINDQKLIEELLTLGVTDATMSALALFPLVWVGWADGRMETREKQAIMKAAQESSIDKESAAMALLESWLSTKPTDELINAWTDYAHNLKKIAAPETVERVKRTVVLRAQEVAEVAGGFLGIGAISDVERAVLEKLEMAFR